MRPLIEREGTLRAKLRLCNPPTALGRRQRGRRRGEEAAGQPGAADMHMREGGRHGWRAGRSRERAAGTGERDEHTARSRGSNRPSLPRRYDLRALHRPGDLLVRAGVRRRDLPGGEKGPSSRCVRPRALFLGSDGRRAAPILQSTKPTIAEASAAHLQLRAIENCFFMVGRAKLRCSSTGTAAMGEGSETVR